MFNCGELTNQILRNSLELIEIDVLQKITNTEALIISWIDILAKKPDICGIDTSIAIKDLKKLNILNKACELHDAGNISGLVYKNLWHSMLFVLNHQVKIVEYEEHE